MIENEVLSEEIKEIFEEHKGRYGSKRIVMALKDKNIITNRIRVRKLMAKMNLRAISSCKKYRHYGKNLAYASTDNLLNQVFTTDNKNKIWLGDITYIPTQKSFLYLAVFIDVFTRKVVGWAMDTRLKDDLTISAFTQAICRENPKPGLVVHTDRGPQYTSDGFLQIVKKHGGISSMSRKGNPYDNALMESFYRTLKTELVKDSVFKDPEHAKIEIFKYIELYYNTKRKHSSIGYMTPVEFEKSISTN